MDRKLLLLAAAVVLMGSLDFFKGYIGGGGTKVGLEDANICCCAKITDEGTSERCGSAECAYRLLLLSSQDAASSGPSDVAEAAPSFFDVDNGRSLGDRVHISYCNS